MLMDCGSARQSMPACCCATRFLGNFADATGGFCWAETCLGHSAIRSGCHFLGRKKFHSCRNPAAAIQISGEDAMEQTYAARKSPKSKDGIGRSSICSRASFLTPPISSAAQTVIA